MKRAKRDCNQPTGREATERTMTMTTKTDRSGAIITVNGLKRKLAAGWILVRCGAQVIDGVSYWSVIDSDAMDNRLVRIDECTDAGIFPSE